MICTAFWHGLRASEVVGRKGLLGKQINNGHIYVQRLKGSMFTKQPLISHIDPLLDERAGLEKLALEVGLNNRMFNIGRKMLWVIMQEAGKKAGIDKDLCHFHILKHSTAMNARKAGMEIEDLKQYMGHKSGSSTMEYLKVDDSEASKAFSAAMGV